MIQGIKIAWAQSGAFFDAGQSFFNGNFWQVFQKKFQTTLSGRVLDIGCGTGALARYINPKSYTGIDNNAYYLAYARRMVTLPQARFHKGDFVRNLPPGTFDIACLISILHHLSDEQIATLCRNLHAHNISRLLIVETLPHGPWETVLKLLDAKLGGGEYFRTQEEMNTCLSPYFRVKEEGVFIANRPFYVYPFILAEAVHSNNFSNFKA